MLAIEVEFLTGRYVATAFNDRTVAEWPPHPARLYCALVATWALDEMSPIERQALEWLAAQPPPVLYASEAFARTPVPVFVPVNDIQTVTEPQRTRHALAQAELAVADTSLGPREATKAQRAVESATRMLATDTARQIAAPADPSGEDLKRGAQVLPESRLRQLRHFPSVTPIEPRFTCQWPDAPPAELRTALAELCARLVRLGHSSSFIRARLVESPTGESLTPDDDGTEVLRVPRPGLLQELEASYASHQEVEPRVLPCAHQRYRRGSTRVESADTTSVFGTDWIVFQRTGGERLPMTATEGVARAFRGGLLKHAETPVARVLSGHEDNGNAAEVPHLAMVPLPFTGSEYADGQLLGVAVIFPRDTGDADRQVVLRAIGAWEETARASQSEGAEDEAPELVLTLGAAGVFRIRRIPFGTPPKVSLRPQTWSHPSRRWASATPIALDKNPGDLQHSDPDKRRQAFAEAEDCIRLACERIGLPAPVEVQVLRSAVLPGSEKPIRFPRFPRDVRRPQRVLVHVRMCFADPVKGPVMLGAGRYLGMGLMRPMRDADWEAK